MLPRYINLPYQPAESIFAIFADEIGAVWLDSNSTQHGEWARYSYMGVEPFALFSAEGQRLVFGDTVTQGNPFDYLQTLLKRYPLTPHPDLPPMQGGVIGYLSYELNQHVEKVPVAAEQDQPFPDMVLGFYDVIIAFDHVQQRSWLISSGLPETTEAARTQRAQQRLTHILQRIQTAAASSSWPTMSRTDIQYNFPTQSHYENTIQRVIDYIYAGDIFQANLTQRFSIPVTPALPFFALYQRLRKINPAPFAGYLNFGTVKIASASPERFLKLHQGNIETCPIKGTRRRGNTAEEDQQLQQALLHSEKDRAENTMIVDLMRNDLSRVAQLHTVNVTELCALYSFASVHHLISTITAQLQPGLDAVDVLCATFPGGSITGAPKIRAMEIIAELEPTRRGPYCGCFGYIGFDGTMDMAITIRTFCMNDTMLSFQTGGAIVADSHPSDEYAETLTKARALFTALCGEESV